MRKIIYVSQIASGQRQIDQSMYRLERSPLPNPAPTVNCPPYKSNMLTY